MVYLGNEGFWFAGGGKHVVVDALYGNGLPKYPVLDTPQRAALEGAALPFERIDLVLDTHFLPDHFECP